MFRASSNTTEANSKALLAAAVGKGVPAIVADLLDAEGAFIDAPLDSEGLTALMIAVSNGDMPMTRCLLDKGARLECVDFKRRSVLMFAAMKGHIDLLKFLLEQGANVACTDIYLMTAMTYAVRSGTVSVVQCLLGHGADLVSLDRSNRNALIHATMVESIPMVRYLLSRGADVTCVDDSGRSALVHALGSFGVQVEILQCLLEAGADINDVNINGKSALHNAMCNGQVEVVQCLLSHGAIVTTVNGRGDSPIHFAHGMLMKAVVKDLIVDAVLSSVRHGLSNGVAVSLKCKSRSHATALLASLPEDIYRCIQEFTSINALLNTACLLADIKRKLFYWKLSRQYSLLYYCSSEFRSILSNLVHNGQKQISLDLRKGTGGGLMILTDIDELRPTVHHLLAG